EVCVNLIDEYRRAEGDDYLSSFGDFGVGHPA
ncbi:tubulin gamma chain, partial [Toxoplasma gondii TgCatPRC2]